MDTKSAFIEGSVKYICEECGQLKKSKKGDDQGLRRKVKQLESRLELLEGVRSKDKTDRSKLSIRQAESKSSVKSMSDKLNQFQQQIQRIEQSNIKINEFSDKRESEPDCFRQITGRLLSHPNQVSHFSHSNLTSQKGSASDMQRRLQKVMVQLQAAKQNNINLISQHQADLQQRNQLINALQQSLEDKTIELQQDSSRRLTMEKEITQWASQRTCLETQINYLKEQFEENQKLHDALVIALQQNVKENKVPVDRKNSQLIASRNSFVMPDQTNRKGVKERIDRAQHKARKYEEQLESFTKKL